MQKIGIIGGGASGIMSAASLILNGYDGEISIFEKNNKLGTKVMISGGGRCNLTTGIRNKKEFLSKYPRGEKFVKYYYGKFGPKKVFERFESQGINLKIENDMRVFPKSNSSKDVLNIFHKLFEKNNVKVHYQSRVESIQKQNDIFKVKTQDNVYEFDKIILTTGGNAYSHTGSSGDGYDFAKSFGHKITKLGPSLNSFKTKQDFSSISGLSFQDGYLVYKGKKVYGPVLFTHFGISGPATFALSSYSSLEEVSENNPLRIQFVPEKKYDYEFLEKYLIDASESSPKKLLKNILYSLYPNKFVDLFLKNNGIDKELKLCYMPKDQRKLISKTLGMGMDIDLIMRRPGDEFVTAGGVDLEGINKESLESKLVSNLYFAGEILDVDGFTGGFNLRWCWASAYILAKKIALDK